MKLLFDENLSRSLVTRLTDLFPGSDHVVLLGLQQSTDAEIFQYAIDHDFVIVTKDSDFNELLTTQNASPALVWIRVGNSSTKIIERLIRANHEQIMDISAADTVGLLMLF
jgi:predicted nuclease of predicted toxin-antitoxin system